MKALILSCFWIRQAPVVSFLGELNAVSTVGWGVTVSGLDFGTIDVTPTSRLGTTNCLTAAWASSTSAVCVPASGEGPTLDTAMTVEAVVGTRLRTFSYDGAEQHHQVFALCLRSFLLICL